MSTAPLHLRGLQDDAAPTHGSVVVHLDRAYTATGEVNAFAALTLIWAVIGAVILLGNRRRA